MNAQLLLPVSLVALSLVTAFGQPQPPQPATIPTRSLALPGQNQPEPPKLTTFSLDFPGGTPRQLVAAIEKAMDRPLNAIIPAEHADVKLPPLKMNNVNVGQLFQALELTSQKTEAFGGTSYGGSGFPSQPGYPGQPGYQTMRTACGFRTPGQGALTDDSIWYFYVEKPNMPPLVSRVIQKVCRFYPLTSYLERGMTVDDITTAIQTGWKMLGDKETPAISFHKETKLLIAVGEAAKLETIDAVLKALAPTPEDAQGGATFSDRLRTLIQRPGPGLSSPPPAKPPEKPKTEN